MKIVRIPFVIVLMVVVGRAFNADAQTETTLHSFVGSPTDGYFSYPGLVQGSDGNFYGTVTYGGTFGEGIIFRISSSGGYTNLYSFGRSFPTDGQTPQAGLVQGSDGNFYGTTTYGGTNGYGTLFRMSSSGSVTYLYSFPGSPTDGQTPQAVLFQGNDGNFYGTTTYGGTSGYGTVFRISPSGSYTSLYSFGSSSPTDGAYPEAGLVQGSDGNFYGTTSGAGSGGGTVFRISLSGVETNLYLFGSSPNDGASPVAVLLQAGDGSFYGTTYTGGTGTYCTGGCGSVFRINPSGIETNLYSFGSFPNDGAVPEAGLVQGSDGDLYGTTRFGGTSGSGTVFRISLSGNYTNLYSFGGSPADGREPFAGLVQGNDGNFYGTTYRGGTNDFGTVFKITVPIVPVVFQITSIAREASDIRITWQTSGRTTNVVQVTPGVAGGSYSNNFVNLSPLIAIPLGVTSTNYLDVGGATNQPSRFYRVKLIAPSVIYTNQAVSAQANIYGAGMASPPDPGGGGGGVLPTAYSLPSNAAYITFSNVTGSITLNSTTGNNLNDPDGVGSAASTSSNSGYSAISGIQAPYAGYIVGVFLGGIVPTNAPPALNFISGVGNNPGTTGFTSLSPLLYQTFFIGDGLTGDGTGTTQIFNVPAGATSLYLGISDAGAYDGPPGFYGDNSGSFTIGSMTITLAP